MLSGFPTIVVCGVPNAAGVSASVEAVPLDYVASFELVSDALGLQRAAVDLKPGKDWLPIALLENTAQWREESQRSEQGNFYKMELTDGLIPGDNPSLRAELTRWVQHRFLLRLRDKTGQKFVVGDPERLGLRFDVRFVSGPTRGHQINFSGVGLGLTPGYEPIF